MRALCLVTLAAVISAGPAFAQTTTQQPRQHGVPPRASDGRPVDFGPNTPQANAAFQGGGMILQGAPGAPAPRPQPTPPGQTPQNMVPLNTPAQ